MNGNDYGFRLISYWKYQGPFRLISYWKRLIAVNKEPLDIALDVYALDTNASKDPELQVNLQGIQKGGPRKISVSLNGTHLKDITVTNRHAKTQKIEIDRSLLKQGTNIVRFVLDGKEYDAALLQSVRLTYERLYEAYDNTLHFTATSGEPIKVSGFADPNIKVIDITDPNDTQIINAQIIQEKDGYSALFKSTGSQEKTYIATISAQNAATIEAKTPKLLHSQNAELIIITHPEFMDATKDLKEYREYQGWKVLLVNIEDIYDEFSFGHKDPNSIRAFLTYAHEKWQTKPTHVLLFGDASFDPRNFLGQGFFDFVPTKLVDNKFNETSSDDWFADTDNDSKPDIAIGRISVRTEKEAENIIDKIIDYESNNDTEGTEKILFVSDADSQTLAQKATEFVPDGWQQKTVQFDLHVNPDTKSILKAELYYGSSIVDYFGHGSEGTWKSQTHPLLGAEGETFFTIDDVQRMPNAPRLPFILAMTCWNGFFHDIYSEQTMAEAFVNNPDGGAIAMLASSTQSVPSEQMPLNSLVLENLFSGKSKTLGQAVLNAKRDAKVPQKQNWILFGDPALHIKGIHSDYPPPQGCSGCNVGLNSDGFILFALLCVLFLKRLRK